MTNSTPNPWSSIPTWLCVLAPGVLLAMFISLALHVRLGLEHWPVPMHEDYQTAAYRAHAHLFIGFALFTVYGAIPVWIVLLCFRRYRVSLKTHLMQAGTYAAGWGLIVAYAALDTGRFVAWFLD